MFMNQQWIVISHDSRAVLLVVHGLIYISAVSCDSASWNSLDSPSLWSVIWAFLHRVFSWFPGSKSRSFNNSFKTSSRK